MTSSKNYGGAQLRVLVPFMTGMVMDLVMAYFSRAPLWGVGSEMDGSPAMRGSSFLQQCSIAFTRVFSRTLGGGSLPSRKQLERRKKADLAWGQVRTHGGDSEA